jgi:hypothetical protein
MPSPGTMRVWFDDRLVVCAEDHGYNGDGLISLDTDKPTVQQVTDALAEHWRQFHENGGHHG